MTESLRKPNSTKSEPSKTGNSPSPSSQTNISDEIVKTINGLPEGLKNYPIRTLVEHAQVFGPDLKRQRLETNQVRKFLDAINRLKASLTEQDDFAAIETEVVLLKPKLAYAAARQDAVKPLNKVMTAAIDKVFSREDFDRLVQLIESIIAYHKAEGGK
jgi:CRISPR-associated protein Csm2